MTATHPGVLTQLAAKVEELYVASQKASLRDRPGNWALYREAYLSYAKTKARAEEQVLRLLAPAIS